MLSILGSLVVLAGTTLAQGSPAADKPVATAGPLAPAPVDAVAPVGPVQRLAILKIVPQGTASADVADTLTQVVAEQVSKTPGYSAISQAEIASLLGVEKQKQMLGCSSSQSCLAEIGGALGAKLVLSGSLGKVGESHVLQLQLLDTQKAQVKARESKTINGAQDKLLNAARSLVNLVLVGKPLETTGEIKLAITPNAAKVVVDGVEKGLSPLAQPLTLEKGQHTLHIEADGYLPIDAAVDVVVGQTLFNSFDLVSVEPIASGGKRTTSRVVGLTLLAVGAAALAGGIVGGVEAQSNYNSYSSNPYKLGYDSVDATGATVYTPGALDYKNNTQTWAWVANGSYIGAAVLGLAGAGFLIYSFAGTPEKHVQTDVQVQP